MHPILLPTKEFAARIHSSQKTARHILRDENGPKVTRIGRRLFVREDHFLSWLDSRTSEVREAQSRPEDEASR